MTDFIAPLLSPSVVAQAKRVAKAIRDGQVASLIGAGLSVPCGVAKWDSLVRRLVLAWKSWDLSRASQTLNEEDYYALIETTMGNDLAAISYLRSRISSKKKAAPTFGQLLLPALYLDASGSKYIEPRPLHTHRHLIALFQHHPKRIWTTNYDDLLEQAAGEAGVKTRTLDPNCRYENQDFSVAHLHGYLPPPRQQEGAAVTDPSTAAIVLAEDDYHSVAANIIGWTNREFFRLFDGYRVLIIGMSLDDPNLRRVLQVTATQADQAKQVNKSAPPRHFAIMRSMARGDFILESGPEGASVYCQNDIDDACEWRSWYWRNHGVELIEIPTHDSILPLLMRLRYESYGSHRGDLWREAARTCESLDPWALVHQGYAHDRLTDVVDSLRQDFAVPDREEIVEVGIFLLKSDATTLELAFRGGGKKRSYQGCREFSADPDRPTGVAGRVFVSSDLVRIPRGHELYDFGIHHDALSSPEGEFEGIISVPIVDWKREGLPLGVIYVTTKTTDGRLFNLPESTPPESAARSLNDLYVWLQKWGLELLQSML